MPGKANEVMHLELFNDSCSECAAKCVEAHLAYDAGSATLSEDERSYLQALLDGANARDMIALKTWAHGPTNPKEDPSNDHLESPTLTWLPFNQYFRTDQTGAQRPPAGNAA